MLNIASALCSYEWARVFQSRLSRWPTSQPDSDAGVAETPAVLVAVGAQDLLGELARLSHRLAVQPVLAFDSSPAAIDLVPVHVPAGGHVERSNGTD